jgi:hypothetical protein
MISLYRGNAHTEWYPKTASETFTVNDLVYLSGGYITKFADAVDQPPLGLIQKTVAATDSDYASATKVPILIGDPNTEYLLDISTGTGAQTYVGTWIDVDDQNSVDVSASTYDIFFVTKHISTTQCVAKMQSQDPYQ